MFNLRSWSSLLIGWKVLSIIFDLNMRCNSRNFMYDFSWLLYIMVLFGLIVLSLGRYVMILVIESYILFTHLRNKLYPPVSLCLLLLRSVFRIYSGWSVSWLVFRSISWITSRIGLPLNVIVEMELILFRWWCIMLVLSICWQLVPTGIQLIQIDCDLFLFNRNQLEQIDEILDILVLVVGVAGEWLKRYLFDGSRGEVVALEGERTRDVILVYFYWLLVL